MFSWFFKPFSYCIGCNKNEKALQYMKRTLAWWDHSCCLRICCYSALHCTHSHLLPKAWGCCFIITDSCSVVFLSFADSYCCPSALLLVLLTVFLSVCLSVRCVTEISFPVGQALWPVVLWFCSWWTAPQVKTCMEALVFISWLVERSWW